MLRLGQRSTRPTAPRTDPATTTGPDQEPEAKRLQHNDASSPGRDGRSEARTQGAPRLVSLGAREDTASGRAARPGGTSSLCWSLLVPRPGRRALLDIRRAAAPPASPR